MRSFSLQWLADLGRKTSSVFCWINSPFLYLLRFTVYKVLKKWCWCGYIKNLCKTGHVCDKVCAKIGTLQLSFYYACDKSFSTTMNIFKVFEFLLELMCFTQVISDKVLYIVFFWMYFLDPETLSRSFSDSYSSLLLTCIAFLYLLHLL